ncbi:hypothetical protein FGB62_21g05 [Gracilaria domingensis]|nr:hypothetical protein FGB62_441g00 [Gracilaria domingensis]KAI0565151.1 hypothetical protein FGB62_21g05 [Gracilaria domingensis]
MDPHKAAPDALKPNLEEEVVTDEKDANVAHQDNHGRRSARGLLATAEFTTKDVKYLLHLVARHQPTADNHWALVSSEYATYARRQGKSPRTRASLKQKFDQLVCYHLDFGQAKQICFLTRRAQPIRHSIQQVDKNQRSPRENYLASICAFLKRRRADNMAVKHSKRVLALLNCMDRVSDCMRMLAEAQLRRLTREKAYENELKKLVKNNGDRTMRRLVQQNVFPKR